MINNMIKNATKSIVATAKTFKEGDSAVCFVQHFENIRDICVNRSSTVKQAYQNYLEAMNYVKSSLKKEVPFIYFHVYENLEGHAIFVKIGSSEETAGGINFVPARFGLRG